MSPVGVRVSSKAEISPQEGCNPKRWTESRAWGWQCAGIGSVCGVDELETEHADGAVQAPANLRRAYQGVVSNKGSPDADGMTVEQLAYYTNQHWPILKARLLAGEYHPPARNDNLSIPQVSQPNA